MRDAEQREMLETELRHVRQARTRLMAEVDALLAREEALLDQLVALAAVPPDAAVPHG